TAGVRPLVERARRLEAEQHGGLLHVEQAVRRAAGEAVGRGTNSGRTSSGHGSTPIRSVIARAAMASPEAGLGTYPIRVSGPRALSPRLLRVYWNARKLQSAQAARRTPRRQKLGRSTAVCVFSRRGV